MSDAVFGIARSAAHASTIVDALSGEGIGFEDISVLYSDNTGGPSPGNASKARGGAATGAGAGGAIGGTLGLLAGIGSMALPGFGPLIAVGPIMGALGGAAVGSAVGGFAGALVGFGIPEHEARVYEAKLRSGRALISVNAADADERDRVQAVFESCGAEDIEIASEKRARS